MIYKMSVSQVRNNAEESLRIIMSGDTIQVIRHGINYKVLGTPEDLKSFLKNPTDRKILGQISNPEVHNFLGTKPLTTQQLAEKLQVCSKTVRKLVKQGKIPEVRVSRVTVLYDPVAVAKSLQENS